MVNSTAGGSSQGWIPILSPQITSSTEQVYSPYNYKYNYAYSYSPTTTTVSNQRLTLNLGQNASASKVGINNAPNLSNPSISNPTSTANNTPNLSGGSKSAGAVGSSNIFLYLLIGGAAFLGYEYLK